MFEWLGVNAGNGCALALSDGTKYQFLVVALAAGSLANLNLYNFTNFTTYAASPLITGANSLISGQIWMRVTQPSTVRTYFISRNGIDWLQVWQETPTTTANTFATPTQAGFFCAGNSVSTGNTVGTLYSWVN
jgi:hypothetical protein